MAARAGQEDARATESRPGPDVKVEGKKDDVEKPKLKLGSQTTRFEEDLSAAVGPAMTASLQPKKKNKNTRPKSKRGLGQPTGFEEWGAEGPLTPEEYELDRVLYNPSKSISDRLEEALMRFDRKRRIEPWRRNIFHKYLQYGGVTTGANFGTGVSSKEVKEMTKEEAMRARTQIMIEKERACLDISFNEVVRGFFGSFYTHYFNPEGEEAIKFAANTISNFYTYLLFHDVCPEYTEDLLRARATCKLAVKELSKNQRVICEGPGPFNKACSFLFGGHFFDYYNSPDEWGAVEYVDGAVLTRDLAQRIVSFGIATGAPHQIASRFMIQVAEKSLTVEQIEDIDGFEVISVTEPDRHSRRLYQSLSMSLSPVGVLKAKSFRDPSKPEIDMSPEERLLWDQGKAPCYNFEFYVEAKFWDLFYPGMKVLAGVWKLSCGTFYFDQLYSAYPSFWSNIANDLMIGWKRPRDLMNDNEDEEWDDAKQDGQKADDDDAQLKEAIGGMVEKIINATHKVADAAKTDNDANADHAVDDAKDAKDANATADSKGKNEAGNNQDSNDSD